MHHAQMPIHARSQHPPLPSSLRRNSQSSGRLSTTSRRRRHGASRRVPVCPRLVPRHPFISAQPCFQDLDMTAQHDTVHAQSLNCSFAHSLKHARTHTRMHIVGNCGTQEESSRPCEPWPQCYPHPCQPWPSCSTTLHGGVYTIRMRARMCARKCLRACVFVCVCAFVRLCVCDLTLMLTRKVWLWRASGEFPAVAAAEPVSNVRGPPSFQYRPTQVR
jgi:hypothetical protein